MKIVLFTSKAFVSLLLAFLAVPAGAAILSFDYTGTIISSPDGIVPVSTNFSGNFSYDDGLSGSASAAGTIYFPADFTLDIDSTTINFTGAVNVDDNSTITLPGNDVIQVGSASISPNPLLNGFLISGIEIDLSDSSETALSDESLPLGFNLADWSVGGRVLAIRQTGSSNVTLGRIDTLASTVPVPAAVWLFGSGVLGLVGITRRKRAA